MIEDPQPALINPSPALLIPLPAKILPNKLGLNAPNKILTNSPFYSLASFWIVLLTPFNNKPESSRDLAILIMSSILWFYIISAVVPDPKIFLCTSASAADAADAAATAWFCYIFQ